MPLATAQGPALVCLKIAIGEQCIQLFTLVSQCKSGIRRVLVTPILSRKRVSNDTVGLLTRQRQTRCPVFAKRGIHHQTVVALAVATGTQSDIRFEPIGRRAVVDDVNQARGRVPAKQGALWTSEHFNPLHVVEVDQGALWAT